MKAHYANDVWQKREQPPDDWARPLPEFMQERNKNTYLELKANEMKAEEERYMQELKELAAAEAAGATDSKSKTNSNNHSSSSSKSNFCTFM